MKRHPEVFSVDACQVRHLFVDSHPSSPHQTPTCIRRALGLPPRAIELVLQIQDKLVTGSEFVCEDLNPALRSIALSHCHPQSRMQVVVLQLLVTQLGLQAVHRPHQVSVFLRQRTKQSGTVMGCRTAWTGAQVEPVPANLESEMIAARWTRWAIDIVFVLKERWP